jgi:hypothetical protein
MVQARRREGARRLMVWVCAIGRSGSVDWDGGAMWEVVSNGAKSWISLGSSGSGVWDGTGSSSSCAGMAGRSKGIENGRKDVKSVDIMGTSSWVHVGAHIWFKKELEGGVGVSWVVNSDGSRNELNLHQPICLVFSQVVLLLYQQAISLIMGNLCLNVVQLLSQLAQLIPSLADQCMLIGSQLRLDLDHHSFGPGQGGSGSGCHFRLVPGKLPPCFPLATSRGGTEQDPSRRGILKFRILAYVVRSCWQIIFIVRHCLPRLWPVPPCSFHLGILACIGFVNNGAFCGICIEPSGLGLGGGGGSSLGGKGEFQGISWQMFVSRTFTGALSNGRGARLW